MDDGDLTESREAGSEYARYEKLGEMKSAVFLAPLRHPASLPLHFLPLFPFTARQALLAR